MKKVAIFIVVLLAAIIGVAIYGASQSETLIRDAVVEYGPRATGAPLSLDKVSVAFMGGKAGLSGLVIGNPQGFKSPHAFKVDDVSVTLDVGSLLEEVIRIREIRIDGADLIYEIGGKGANISKIQKNIEAYSAGLGMAASEGDSAARFIVDDIYINGTRVKLASDLAGGREAGLTLPDIHLKNIGTEDKAATAGEVATAIFGALNKSLGKVVTRDMLDKTLGDVKKKLGDIFK